MVSPGRPTGTNRNLCCSLVKERKEVKQEGVGERGWVGGELALCER